MRLLRSLAICASLFLSATSFAQQNVTDKYIQNADFGARFAGWINPGSFTFNTANTFSGRSGEVWMEKWVSAGSKLGNNSGMFQTLRNLPAGTYTLTASAHNIQQNSSTVCKGAFIFAGQEQTEISEAGTYSVVFTVVNGKTDIGVKLSGCTGNWVCIDNFKLYYNGENADSLAAEQARLDAELTTLKENIANATGNVPKVTTSPYVATGVTIALARASFTANGSTITERGFCWSKMPEPTIFDDCSTSTFSNNGNIYRIDGLEPATFYYLRPYAITKGWQVAYGETVKIATMPRGSVSCGYDYQGSEQENYRINSAMQECVWMYNNLANIKGLYLNVHYVQGAGAGGGTADCSYGGWMRVSQNVPYQQTGTLLHETNHGVGVGTTNEWYNNGNLRAETSRGTWLGPRATDMVRFFENNNTATMTGDGTHMWPYGINGAHEDSYNPSNQCLYFANILITHAMHQDGLIATSSVGFATPAYVFRQDDNAKYYIKCEDKTCGGLTTYLGMTSTGTLKSFEVDATEVVNNDDYAWNITYDPKTCYYMFYNIGQGKYLTNNSGTIKGATKTNVTSTEKFHMMPSRNVNTSGSYSDYSYWILTSSGHKAMQGSSSYSASTQSYAVSTADFNAANSASAQRWMLLAANDVADLEEGNKSVAMQELTSAIANVKKLVATPHRSNTEELTTEAIDNTINGVIEEVETRDSYASALLVQNAIGTLNDAMLAFLADVAITDADQPFDLTFLIKNPGFDTDANGWTPSVTVNYSCAEVFQKSVDMSQTIDLKLPKGTYEVRVQGFQRPGALDDVYTAFVKNNENGVKGTLYAKGKSVTLKHICEEYSTASFTGGKVPTGASRFYVPNTMEGAANLFKKGYYENSAMVTTAVSGTFKFGIKTATSSTGTWTIFDNFRLLSYGSLTQNDITPVISVEAHDKPVICHDLQGRRIQQPKKGLYIINGKKVVL